MCAIALLAITSTTQAEFISGSINFSSATGGGIVLQDSAGNITTDLAKATGVQSWSLAEVDDGTDSFATVANGTSVSFSQSWIFNPSTSMSPLWTIGGPENFTFNLTSSTIIYQSGYLLAIRGTGTLSGTGFDDTPGSWLFSTQGAAMENQFCWSSSTVPKLPPSILATNPPLSGSVPDGGTAIVLLSGSLLGLLGLQRRFGKQ
jgi:VPDSG-CTERM motif